MINNKIRKIEWFLPTLKRIKPYFWLSLIIFIFGIIAGYFFHNQFQPLIDQMAENIKNIITEMGPTPSVSKLFSTIFITNLTSSLTLMLFGILFGIIPLTSLFANGLLLGYIYYQSTIVQGLNWYQILIGIIPHGILELPAVFLAAAFGFRIAHLIIQTITLGWKRDKREIIKTEWSHTKKDFFLILIIIVSFLLIAAIIESTITPLLLKKIL